MATAPPNWTRDELILALDCYFKTLDAPTNEAAKEVAALSQLLRKLPIFSSEVREAPRFRNVAGVGLKIMNFKSLDPNYAGSGMSHCAAADIQVWNDWNGRQQELAQVAAAIREAGASTGIADVTEEDEEEYGAVEGRLLYRRHKSRERDRRLVRKKKEQVLAQSGALRCEACDMEPTLIFGGDFVDIFDVHHVRPLSEAGVRLTTLADLALLCPTCHRVIHSAKSWMTPAQLRDRLATGSRAVKGALTP